MMNYRSVSTYHDRMKYIPQIPFKVLHTRDERDTRSQRYRAPLISTYQILLSNVRSVQVSGLSFSREEVQLREASNRAVSFFVSLSFRR